MFYKFQIPRIWSSQNFLQNPDLFGKPKPKPLQNLDSATQQRLLLTQRFLTFGCVPCVKVKDTDEVLPVKESSQLP